MRHVSVTQVQKYLDCPRKWWFEYVAREKSPPTLAQTAGQETHTRIEGWLERGEWDDAISHIVPLLPPPGEGWYTCEVPISPVSSPNRERRASEPPPLGDLRPCGVPLIGYVDLVVSEAGGKLPVGVYDFKTTGRASYLLSAAAVAKTLQMGVYAHVFLTAHPDLVGCAVGHLGIPPSKDGPPRWAIGHIGRSEAAAAYARIEAAVGLMLADGAARNPFVVTAERSFCSRYGGCPHRGTCAKG